MKNIYIFQIFLFFTLLCVNVSVKGAPEVFNQVSSTCTDVFEGRPLGLQVEDINGNIIDEVGDIVYFVLTIPNAESINFDIKVFIQEFEELDVLEFYKGAISDNDIKYTLNDKPNNFSHSFNIDSNVVTLKYYNGELNRSDFDISWLGILPSTNTVTHNCNNGGLLGSAEITSVTGAAPYEYLWSGDGETVYEIEGKVADTYYYTVTDANECQAIDTVKILEPSADFVVSEVGNTAICYGAENGQITLDATGGYNSLPYDFEWHDGSNNAIRNDLSKGFYSYTVTDSNLCEKTGVVEMTQPTDPLTITLLENTPISCNTANGTFNDGIIEATPAGGYTASYKYNWGAGFFAPNTDGNKTFGVAYNCIVQDDNGCETTSSDITLSEPEELFANAEIVDSIPCNSGNTDNAGMYKAYLLATPTGGAGSYGYLWQDGSTKSDTLVEAGTYFCIVEDANGCTDQSDDLIPIKPSIIVVDSLRGTDYNGYPISCFVETDGGIKIEVSGGHPNYSYAWGSNANNQATDSAFSLGNGTYVVTVTDANSCTETRSFELNSPLAITYDIIIKDVKNFGGSDGEIEIITIENDVVGVRTEWTGDNVTLDLLKQTSLIAGFYSVVISDSNQCTASGTFEVTEPLETDGGEIEIDGSDSPFICYNLQELISFNNITIAFKDKDIPKVTYSWQYTKDGNNWIDFSGAADNFFNFDPNDTVSYDLDIRRRAEKADPKGPKEAFSNIITLDYLEDKTPSLYNLAGDYCQNADSSLIIGIPSGGTFSSTSNAVYDNLDGTAYYKPYLMNLPLDLSVDDTVVYFFEEYGCVSTVDSIITVNPVPVPEFIIEDKYVITRDSAHISGVTPPPSGAGGTGVFTGQTVTYNDTSANLFPSNLELGSYDVSYSYTNVYGCEAETIKPFEIIESTVEVLYDGSSNFDPVYCYDGDSIRISIGEGASPIYDEVFVFNAWIRPDPLAPLDSTIGVFSPKTVYDNTGGYFLIDYKYKTVDGGTYTDADAEINIVNIIGEASINDAKINYCTGQGDVIMHANPLPASASGTFSGLEALTGTGDEFIVDVNALTSIVSGTPDTLIYTYTHNTSGCFDTAEYPFPVYELPEVEMIAKDTFNVVEATIPLGVKFPDPATGVEFLIHGIVDAPAEYNPAIAGVGIDTIFMRYQDPNTTCVNIDTNEVLVKEAHGSFIGLGDSIFCYKGAISKIYVDIADREPGGSFSISDHVLVPEEYDADSLFIDPLKFTPDDSCTISYTYKLLTQDTYFTISAMFYIDDVGKLEVVDLNYKNCEYDEIHTIKGMIDGSIVSFGDFTCDSVLLLNNAPVDDGEATFDPDEINVDSIWPTVTFTYMSRDTFRINPSTCTDYVDTTIKIYNRPIISFTDPLKAVYNKAGENDTISATPLLGIFSGDGIVNSSLGIFNPGIPASSPATNRYTYTDTNTTCTHFEEQITDIQTAQGIFVNTDSRYCYEDIDYTISMSALNTNSGSGKFSGFGITDNGDWSTAILNPKKMYDESGNMSDSAMATITFTFYVLEAGDSAKFEITKEVYVRNLSYVAFDIPLLNSEVCRDGSLVNLTNMPSELGGTFATDTTPTIDLVGDNFNPLTASSEYNVILYTYVFDGCEITREDSLFVHEEPDITFPKPLSAIYNVIDANDTIIAFPANGTFSGEGIENITLGIFNPSIPAGSNSTVTYTYEDPSTTCDNFKIMSTELYSAQGVFENVDIKYCYEDDEYPISIAGLDANSIDGIFRGKGISDNGDGSTATLNPSVAFDSFGLSVGEIESEVEYSYKIEIDDDTAYFKIVKLFKVNNVTEITFTIEEKSNDSVCRQSTLIDLNEMPNTSGGIFYRVSEDVDIQLPGGNFDPVTADSGANIIKYVFDNGDCSIIIKDTIFIQEHPVADFDFVASMCLNDSIILEGIPRGGSFSGQSFTKLRNSLDSELIDSVRFLASVVNTENEFIYTVSSDFGCESSIKKQLPIYENPDLSFSVNFVEEYCINGDIIDIYGRNNENQVSEGFFSGNNIYDVDSNGTFKFDPTSYVDVNIDTITFSYTDEYGCSSIVSQKIEINGLPDISINGLDDSDYCPYVGDQFNVSGNRGVTSGSDGLDVGGTNYSSGSHSFRPSDYTHGVNVEFIYTYTDGNNCENKTSKTVKINHLPKANFRVDNECISDPIQFFYTGGTIADSIAQLYWEFGFNDEKDSINTNPSFPYTVPDNYTVSLTITNDEGCVDFKDTTYSFGFGPVADFSWVNECEGAIMQFQNKTDKDVKEWKWEVGEEQISTDKITNYEFPSFGEYEVKLTAIESDKCTHDTIKTVSIRPVIDVNAQTEYFDSFENEYSGWAAELLSSEYDNITWVNSLPDGGVINSAYDGNNAWVTNAEGNYKNYEISAVTSPCFDLGALKKPMVSFWYWADAESERDGAVLQYKKENDANDTIWHIIGSHEDGIEWYNFNAISGKPGDELQGWTGNTNGWKEAKHDLNDLTGTTNNVRFRVAFASDISGTGEGFAFDNFRIGERKKRVLIEHFTNSESSSATSADNNINSLVGRYPLDAIDIQYHTSSPSGDMFYQDYPTGSNVRSIYYNVNDVPYARLDGEYDFTYNGQQSAVLLNAAMVDPGFTMEIETAISGGTMNITHTVQSVNKIENKQLYLMTAIVEKEVTIEGSSVVFNNVLRSFIPSASGEALSKNWDADESQQFTLSYNIDDFVNAEALSVIAFIQDENTKEILQTVTTDTTSVSTALDQLFSDSNGLDILIYPNPAQQQVNILLSETANTNGELHVVNQQGSLVDVIDVTLGSRIVKLNTDNYSEGVYFINYINNNERLIKKLIIIK